VGQFLIRALDILARTRGTELEKLNP